jgi:hypothetical protein
VSVIEPSNAVNAGMVKQADGRLLALLCKSLPSVSFLVDWFVGLLFGWLVDWLVVWLVGCLVGWLFPSTPQETPYSK